jgi:hypothetical protein
LPKAETVFLIRWSPREPTHRYPTRLIRFGIVRGVGVSVALLTALLVAGCGSQPWHPAHHVRVGTFIPCGTAVSPDRSKVLAVCYKDGVYSCWDTQGATQHLNDAAVYEVRPFSSDCKAARAALVKHDYIP